MPEDRPVGGTDEGGGRLEAGWAGGEHQSRDRDVVLQLISLSEPSLVFDGSTCGPGGAGRVASRNAE